MLSLDALETELKENIKKIQASFLRNYFPADPSHTPDKYEYDVKAFCILAHAIFEEFAEKISLEVMREAESIWTTKRVISRPLLLLCISYGAKIEILEDELTNQPTAFNQIRASVQSACQAHSKMIFDNHGFSLKYLRRMFTPVSIDVSSDPRFSNSLRVLANARGSYAHRSAKEAMFSDGKASRPMTPENARDVVEDCLELCLALANATKPLFE